MTTTTKAVHKIAEPSNGGFQTICLEDEDNNKARVKFFGRAMKLKTFGYPQSGKIVALQDGDIEGLELIEIAPTAGSADIADYNTFGNGRWTYIAHEVSCDEDDTLPPTDVVIKNFVIWWRYEKTVNNVMTTYTLIEVIQLGMPACVHLGECPSGVAPAPKPRKAKKGAKTPGA